jgi:signal transduction histidine kinase
MIVDDEPASRRAVERALADDCRVVAAAGGAEALQCLAAEPMALIVSDQRMPDMLGTRLLEECTLRHPEVVRVLLTGYTEVDTLLDAINAGHVWAYVTKPWEPRDLRVIVRRGLERFAADVERRGLVAELESACARARREAEGKGRLLALAAHELGTPMHIAANAVELIAATETTEAAQRWIEAARGVGQLHHAGRWRCGDLRLSKAPFDLGSMLADLIDCHRAVAARRRLELDVSLDRRPRVIDGDRRWIECAVANVLSNAVRFTPDGGHLRVALEEDGEIVVGDDGIGIAAHLLPLVFEPFSAAGGEIALHGSGQFDFGARGLGLGLAVAKAAVEAHGGRIALQSTVGQGTCVRITLPVDKSC